MRILFVCAGDAGRSQMAEAFYNHITGTRDAASAGTEVIVGKPMPPRILSIMNELGISMSGHYRKQITKEMFDEAERVILMTNKSLPDYLKGDKVAFWDVDDPRQQEMDVFYRVREEILAKVNEMIER